MQTRHRLPKPHETCEVHRGGVEVISGSAMLQAMCVSSKSLTPTLLALPPLENIQPEREGSDLEIGLHKLLVPYINIPTVYKYLYLESS